MKRFARSSGFTLIEVVAALAILGWALSGAIYTVHHYAGQRAQLSDKLFASQVAWNSLMENYRYAEKWTSSAERGGKPRKGTEQQHGRDWQWKVTIKPAMGKDFYRYQAEVGASNTERNLSTLSLYIVED